MIGGVHPVTDVHTHYVPHGWPPLPGEGDRPSLRVDGPSEATIMLGDKEFRRVTDNAWNADVRLAAMDGSGVDRQVLSPTPVFFAYDQPPGAAAATAAILNDLALAIAAEAPDRLIPFCQVPLQDPDAACRELDRRDRGRAPRRRDRQPCRRPRPGRRGHRHLPAALRGQGWPVFVHPWDMPDDPRTRRWMAQWLVGMPAETHLSILAMILGGVFDEVGNDLRICFAHGGGSFAFWLGRVENAWHRRRDVVGTSAQPPREYVGRFTSTPPSSTRRRCGCSSTCWGPAG